MAPPRIIFMGTPEFAVPSLRILVEQGLAPMAVVTGPDRRSGRGRRCNPTAVKDAALNLGISIILQPDSVKDPAFAGDIATLHADVIVVVAFKILPSAVFSSARLGAFNLHASLLPAYRGAAPINHAILAGEAETGITTFLLNDHVDTGSIILQRRLPIGPNDTAGIVHDRLKELGARGVLDTVKLLITGQAITRAQCEASASGAPKIFPEHCRIPWNATASHVHNHCRGLSPYPGAWTYHQDLLIKILETRPQRGQGTPGLILRAAGEDLVVACGEGAIEVCQLQQQGRRRLDTASFLNGYALRVDDRFA